MPDYRMMMVDEAVVTYFKTVSRHSSGGTERYATNIEMLFGVCTLYRNVVRCLYTEQHFDRKSEALPLNQLIRQPNTEREL
jgi:hypothetical protein